jgi:DNA-binding CsgD family transcriptional regulator
MHRPAVVDTSRLDALSPREIEVLGLMAEGRTNLGIARELVLSCGAVEKHVANIFAKLALPRSPVLHRRVLAVLTYLTERGCAVARPSGDEAGDDAGQLDRGVALHAVAGVFDVHDLGRR